MSNVEEIIAEIQDIWQGDSIEYVDDDGASLDPNGDFSTLSGLQRQIAALPDVQGFIYAVVPVQLHDEDTFIIKPFYVVK